MERLTLTETVGEAVAKMAEGNPGAVRALAELMKSAPKIDPDSAWGSLGPLISLDRLGIYGPSIWVLYKDVCGFDCVKVETLLRANQLGMISDSVIQEAADHRRTHKPVEIDFAGLLDKIRERLPAFARDEGAALQKAMEIYPDRPEHHEAKAAEIREGKKPWL